MDIQDQAKDHMAGHEGHGVHVCHKCGWSFPNPHPSAKHRRAHKKICGTIEGYKLVDSEETPHLTVSDEEHLSDGDHETPSPKLLERSGNEIGGGGTGQRSARSDDDVFTDAVAEFPDGGFSPGMEGHPGCIKELATNTEVIVVNNARNTPFEGDANTAITPPLDNSADSSLMQNTEVPKVNPSGSVQGSLDHVSSAAISSVAGPLTESRGEVFSSQPCDDKGGFACDSNTNKLDMQSNANKVSNESNGSEGLTDHVTTQNSDTSLDRQLMYNVLLTSQDAETASNTVPEMGKADDVALIPAQPAGILLSEKVQTDDSKVTLNDLPPEANQVECMNDFVDPVEIKMNTAEKIDGAGSGDPTKSFDVLGELGKDMHVVAFEGFNALGESGENVRVLSVPASTGNAEIMIEGFKDHKGGRLPQLVQGTSLEVDDDGKGSVPEGNLSTSHLSVITEDTVKHMLIDKLEQEHGSGKPMVKNLPDEEADIPQVTNEIKEVQRSEELGTITAVEREKSNIVQIPEKQPLFDYKDEQLVMSSAKHDIDDLASANPVVGQMDTEIRQKIGLVVMNDADNSEKAAIERCDTAGDNATKRKESSMVNSTATSEPVEFLSEQEVNTKNDLIGGINAADHEKNEIEGYDVSSMATGKSDSAATLVEDKLPMRAQTTSKSAVELHISGSATDLSDIKLTDTEHTHPGGVQDAQEVVKEVETAVSDEIQGEHVGGISIPAEDDNGVDVKAIQKSAEEHLTKEPAVSSLETSTSIPNSGIVEDDSATDFVQVASANTSKFLSGEGESNLDSKAALQQLGTSANDFSVDSSSQTDSLEGHWGSVSVLSIQSDIPAIVDAEQLRSNGSQAPAEADEARLKGSKAASEGQHSDKSDIFDPPSFMTLVEPSDGTLRKTAASEIQMAQNPQQEKIASLEAGWFPSLTNVANESEGRKKNEKIIAKVTNWNAGKQHAPLKSLLRDANADTKSMLPNATENPGPLVEKDGTAAKDDGALLTTVSSVMAPEEPNAEGIKRDAAKEWNSPARYPAEIKREKKKVKGKPSWAQFVCCSSGS